ncbi:MucR family transcriptional regulator [Salipiger sp. PrR002]|uniref:MucR family transcriptional regulator n=1 Tax=Salipiger sp. PrR002 TaxID=2706489 RepID=UPI0013B85251|nr:MucR family transcriptional regulator [Salipiger sp. PrR002]NDW00955.1 MucR family transcriptional regulator [Salipiger sp. PrR002]NDW56502.1 MucR family transcriptional regulator [Salipiger sp. PrR004]
MGKVLHGFLSRVFRWRRVEEAPLSEESYSMLVCRETGMQKPLLRRHLQEVLGMTPEQYRKKWRLPEGSPLASKAYIDRREAARNMECEG